MNRRVVRTLIASVFTSAVVLSILVSLGGCETVKGVGKDVQGVGEAGERAIK